MILLALPQYGEFSITFTIMIITMSFLFIYLFLFFFLSAGIITESNYYFHSTLAENCYLQHNFAQLFYRLFLYQKERTGDQFWIFQMDEKFLTLLIYLIVLQLQDTPFQF